LAGYKKEVTSMTTADKLKSIGAVAVTVITGLIAVWWLFEVSRRLGIAPTPGPGGDIVVDEFQRAKDILVIVLPLFTAAIGYWVGSQGTTEAKKDADEARDKLEAVVSEAPSDVLERARAKHREAFTRR
jgi:hypothetical protein